MLIFLMYSMNFHSLENNYNMQQLLLCALVWLAGSIFIALTDTKSALK